MIIGLIGRAGSGKSTLARAICAHDPNQFYTERSLAAPLKDLCIGLFGLSYWAVYGTSDLREAFVPDSETWGFWSRARARAQERHHEIYDLFSGTYTTAHLIGELSLALSALNTGRPVTVRQILQVVGTDWGRRLDNEVWIRAALDKCPKFSVFSDVRFPNEADSIRARGGRLCFLNARRRLPPLADTAHPSEPRYARFVDKVDLILDTSGAKCPEALAKQVLALSAR